MVSVLVIQRVCILSWEHVYDSKIVKITSASNTVVQFEHKYMGYISKMSMLEVVCVIWKIMVMVVWNSLVNCKVLSRNKGNFNAVY